MRFRKTFMMASISMGGTVHFRTHKPNLGHRDQRLKRYPTESTTPHASRIWFDKCNSEPHGWRGHSQGKSIRKGHTCSLTISLETYTSGSACCAAAQDFHCW